mgnify:CR=1 FL=1
MRYTQLRAFHHVATEGGFSRAAKALGLSQPAISDQVRSLEADYDVRLFDRGTRSVRLTGDGQRLLEITRRLFDAEGDARELLSEQRTRRTGTLRIHADSPHHILQTLARFRAAHSHVSVKVRTGNSAGIVAALQAYEADIGILGEIPSGKAFDVVPLGASPIVAFARLGGPLDGLEEIALVRLLDLPLVLREEGSKTRAKLAEAAGGRLPQGIEAEGREAVREIVAAGGGVGIVSEAEYVDDPRLTRATITSPRLSMEESVACLHERGESRLIRAFMAMARHAAA